MATTEEQILIFLSFVLIFVLVLVEKKGVRFL